MLAALCFLLDAGLFEQEKKKLHPDQLLFLVWDEAFSICLMYASK
ncbi:hypothetical protein [Brevibacillus parabrevis]|nr:hypothetical protein [Brevibacillus parabrevis]